VDRAELERLVTRGATVREIAIQTGHSAPSVRYWLDRFGLTTYRTAVRRAGRAARARGETEFQFDCPTHGPTPFRWRQYDGFRCLRCRSEAVARRRRKAKAMLVAEAGGSCRVCGYDRCAAALEFHHLDRATKSFNLGFAGVTRSIDAMRAEAAKCVLLCSNCHAEVEAGVTELKLPGWDSNPQPTD
jgi:hypothetical protein